MAKRRQNRSNPSSLLFWNDLRADPALRRCSLEARGLWAVHALPCAAESPEYGVLIIGNCASRLEDLGDLFANECGRPADVVQGLFVELVSKGAASVDDEGRVFCRRMVREERERRRKAEAGRAGGKASGAVRRSKQTPKQTPQQSEIGLASSDAGRCEAGEHADDVGNIDTSGHSAEAERDQMPSSGLSKNEHSSLFSLHASKEDISSDEEIAPSGARASGPDSDQAAVQAVVDLWDQYAAEIPKWPKTRGMSSSRRSAIRARLREHGLDGIRAALERAKASRFIRQTGMRGWNLGWLMKPDNFIKVIEGVYDGHGDGRPEAVGRMEVSARVIDRLRQQEVRNG